MSQLLIPAVYRAAPPVTIADAGKVAGTDGSCLETGPNPEPVRGEGTRVKKKARRVTRLDRCLWSRLGRGGARRGRCPSGRSSSCVRRIPPAAPAEAQ